jgi:hypothetical protein
MKATFIYCPHLRERRQVTLNVILLSYTSCTYFPTCKQYEYSTREELKRISNCTLSLLLFINEPSKRLSARIQ